MGCDGKRQQKSSEVGKREQRMRGAARARMESTQGQTSVDSIRSSVRELEVYVPPWESESQKSCC